MAHIRTCYDAFGAAVFADFCHFLLQEKKSAESRLLFSIRILCSLCCCCWGQYVNAIWQNEKTTIYSHRQGCAWKRWNIDVKTKVIENSQLYPGLRRVNKVCRLMYIFTHFWRKKRYKKKTSGCNTNASIRWLGAMVSIATAYLKEPVALMLHGKKKNVEMLNVSVRRHLFSSYERSLQCQRSNFSDILKQC